VRFSIDELNCLTYSITVRLIKTLTANSMIKTTYSQARQNLASLLDQVTGDREIAIIKRRGSEDVALVSADELAGLLETAHLLRSPANAKRLLAALHRAQSKRLPAMALDAFRAELGLDGAE
jgi:antitoxin YefM